MAPQGVRGSGDDDNVIYLNFGRKQRVSSAAETSEPERRSPLDAARDLVRETERRREAPGTWNPGDLKRHLDNLIFEHVEPGRAKRGLTYARAGNVVDLELRDGAVHGRVAGSQNEPFAVVIQLPRRDGAKQAVTALIADVPNGMQRARSGEFSHDLLDYILGEEPFDLRISCDCPDPERLCKHVMAVATRWGQRLESDPEQVLALRGLSFATIDESAIAHANKEAERNAGLDTDASGESDDEQTRAERNDRFWNGRQLPDLPRPKVAPALDDSDPDLLRKAMRAVSYTNIDLLRAISDVEDLYHGLTH